MRHRRTLVTLLALAALTCCMTSAALAQSHGILKRPAPPLEPKPTPERPTCPGTNPINPGIPTPFPKPLPRPIINPGIPTPFPRPIINPGIPTPIPTPIPRPISPGIPIVLPTPPLPVTPAPIPVPPPPVVVTPAPPMPAPRPDPFRNRPLKFVVIQPAMMPPQTAGSSPIPDTQGEYHGGLQTSEFTFNPTFNGALVQATGSKVGDGWMGVTYTQGPYSIPGFGKVVPAYPSYITAAAKPTTPANVPAHEMPHFVQGARSAGVPSAQ